jgi:hypothetical protein
LDLPAEFLEKRDQPKDDLRDRLPTPRRQACTQSNMGFASSRTERGPLNIVLNDLSPYNICLSIQV